MTTTDRPDAGRTPYEWPCTVTARAGVADARMAEELRDRLLALLEAFPGAEDVQVALRHPYPMEAS